MLEEDPTPELRYDDDEDSFYTSNAEMPDGICEQDKKDLRKALRLGDASTFDLFLELETRFNHFVCMGKRFIIKDAEGGDREEDRANDSQIDNRIVVKGDAHTLYGMSAELKASIEYGMESGYDTLKYGFGPIEMCKEDYGED